MRLASQRKYALILIDTCIYLAVYAATVLIAFQSSTIETSSPEKYLITAIILYCTVFGMRFIARVYNNVWPIPARTCPCCLPIRSADLSARRSAMLQVSTSASGTS